MKNPVKAKLKEVKLCIGTWVTVGHLDISESPASLGFDWVFFGMGHGSLSVETAF